MKRTLILLVTIIAYSSTSANLHAERLFQGRLLGRLFGVEKKSESPKPVKEKKKKQNQKPNKQKQENEQPSAASPPQEAQKSFNSRGFGMLVQKQKKRLAVRRIAKNGMAKHADIRVGDQIVKIAGVEVDNVEIFQEIEKVLEPGNEVEIILRRSGKRIPTNVSFGKLAPAASESTSETHDELNPPAEPTPLEPTPAVRSENDEFGESILKIPG